MWSHRIQLKTLACRIERRLIPVGDRLATAVTSVTLELCEISCVLDDEDGSSSRARGRKDKHATHRPLWRRAPNGNYTITK